MTRFYILNVTDEKDSEKWKLSTEMQGTNPANFISRNDLNIRLKIDWWIDLDSIDMSNDNRIVILDPSRMANDYKNMNPIILRENDDEMDHDYVILTVGPDYGLLRYKWTESMLGVCSTFISEGTKMVGCVCEISSKKDANFGHLKVYHHDTGDIFDVSLYVKTEINEKGTSVLRFGYIMTKITDWKDVHALKTIQNKYKKSLRFKFVVNRPVTKVYVTTPENESFLTGYLSHYPDIKPIIYTIPEELLSNTEEMIQILSSIKENRVRAITEFGLKLPYDVICALKVLYIFMMESTEDIIKLTCIKAN